MGARASHSATEDADVLTEHLDVVAIAARRHAENIEREGNFSGLGDLVYAVHDVANGLDALAVATGRHDRALSPP